MSSFGTNDNRKDSLRDISTSPRRNSAFYSSKTHSRTCATTSPTTTSSHNRTHTSTLTYPGGGRSRQVICAVIESRGTSPTVGLACVSLSTSKAILCQIADNQTYTRTIHKLWIWEPSILLIPSTAVSPAKSKLAMFLEADTNIDSPRQVVDRKYFNEADGQEKIDQLALGDELDAVKVAIEGKYYAAACLSAVLQYMQLAMNVAFASHSLRVILEPSEGSMMIDLSTIRSMELVQNSQNRHSRECLFGLLNQTATPMGARLLRSNILQPLTDPDVLLKRYEVVEELCTREQMFLALRRALSGSLDVDRALTNMVLVPGRGKLEEWLMQGINHTLILKSYIQSIAPIYDALQSAHSYLLRQIVEMCRPENYSPIEQLIHEGINRDTVYSKTPAQLEAQRTFAIKSGTSGMLDVARQVYVETTDDIGELYKELAEVHDFNFSLAFERRRGYFLRLQISELEHRHLDPEVFVNVIRNKKFAECQTMNLVKLNNKLFCSQAEVVSLSLAAVKTLIEQIRSHIAPLFRISDSIALLDVLTSFAQLASQNNYIRPVICSTLAIKAARHPIKVGLPSLKFIPNDCYAADSSRLQIITGCHMSGKSTYIRTVLLLHIMAQIGSFVPAEHASFRIRSQVCARMSSDDNVNASVSTFAHEMKEMAFILRNVDSDSLVIIDELGRGTSSSDGLALATSIAEALLESHAFVWFVTHFHELATFLSDLSGVVNLHLASELKPDIRRMSMLYKIRAGAVAETSYGISMGQVIDLPRTVIEDAVAVSELLKKRRLARSEDTRTFIQTKKRKLLLGLKDQLLFVRNSSLSSARLNSWLKALQDEFVLQMDSLNCEEQTCSDRNSRLDSSLSQILRRGVSPPAITSKNNAADHEIFPTSLLLCSHPFLLDQIYRFLPRYLRANGDKEHSYDMNHLSPNIPHLQNQQVAGKGFPFISSNRLSNSSVPRYDGGSSPESPRPCQTSSTTQVDPSSEAPGHRSPQASIESFTSAFEHKGERRSTSIVSGYSRAPEYLMSGALVSDRLDDKGEGVSGFDN